MTGQDLYQTKLEDGVFVVSLQQHVNKIMQAVLMSESKLLSDEFK